MDKGWAYATEREAETVDAVCRLFHGQEVFKAGFAGYTTPQACQDGTSLGESPPAVRNRLKVTDDEILENLNSVQLKHGISPTPKLDSGTFTVETDTNSERLPMFLCTAFELNKRFGFKKFLILVPTNTVQEEVTRFVEKNRERLRDLYERVPFNFYSYRSARVSQIRHFTESGEIEIMALKSQTVTQTPQNKLYRETEQLGSETPIDMLRATNPIVIMDGTAEADPARARRAEQSLQALKPLCIIHYRPIRTTNRADYQTICSSRPEEAAEIEETNQQKDWLPGFGA